MNKKPQLNISILSDYICPFCYIANLRLSSLREVYDLKINWCFIEIHPETPSLGHSIKLLNYSDDTWNTMMKELLNLAQQENITLSDQTITTNSRKALLLSEACKALGADVFYPLHEQIFHAYFIDGLNIGDETVLRDIAHQNNIPENLINEAWSDPYAQLTPDDEQASSDNAQTSADSVPASLLPYLQYAGYLKASSVPTLIAGEQVHGGVLSRSKLLSIADEVVKNH